MKKTVLWLTIILSSFYSYSQTLEKTNKRYEAFLAEQRRNPDLKLKKMTLKFSSEFLDKQEILDERLNKLLSAEAVIQISTGNDRNVIVIIFKEGLEYKLDQTILDNVFGHHYSILKTEDYEN